MNNPGVKYGLIAGLVYIIFGLINYLFDLSTSNQAMGAVIWLGAFLATFAVTFVACREKRDNSGSITVSEGIKLGVTIALIAGILAGLFTVLYTMVIDPDVMARQLEMVEQQWEEQGMSDEQIEQSRQWVTMFQNPVLTVPFTIIFYVIGGLIKGAISGAILRRD